MQLPVLPDTIEVLPGTDVAGEFERFYALEALHHTLRICNPMTSGEVDRLLDLLVPVENDRFLDIACGHGELVLRAAAAANLDAVGVDLSPWTLLRAAKAAEERLLVGRVRWWLGSGTSIEPLPRWNLVTCIGAPWIWHGFGGTLRALVSRSLPGARIAIGDLRLKEDSSADAVPGASVLDRDAQLSIAASLGLVLAGELVASARSWEAYRSGLIAGATLFAAAHPAEPGSDFRAMAEDSGIERDRQFLEWSVLVFRR